MPRYGTHGVPIYSTYLGGNDWVDARAVAVDAGGNAYVTGDTKATDLGIAGAWDRRL